MKTFRMPPLIFEMLYDKGITMEILPASLQDGERIQVFEYDGISLCHLRYSVVAIVVAGKGISPLPSDNYQNFVLKRVAKVVYKSGELAFKDYAKL